MKLLWNDMYCEKRYYTNTCELNWMYVQFQQLSTRGIPCHILNSCAVCVVQLFLSMEIMGVFASRCLTNDADQNCSSPECCGQVNDSIEGMVHEMVHVIKKVVVTCMINRYFRKCAISAINWKLQAPIIVRCFAVFYLCISDFSFLPFSG